MELSVECARHVHPKVCGGVCIGGFVQQVYVQNSYGFGEGGASSGKYLIKYGYKWFILTFF